MEFQLVFLLSVVAFAVGDNDGNKHDELGTIPGVNGTQSFYPTKPEDQLYHDISLSNYDRALTVVQGLIKYGQTGLVKTAIDVLIKHRTTQIAGFAYKLWAAGHKDIVETKFPEPYRMVFNNSLLKFTNNRYQIPIEFSRFEDGDGDVDVYGKEDSARSNNYIWKLEPAFDDKEISFKIRHYLDSRYLKLGNDMDSDGEYKAFGSTNSDTKRHQWLFQPVDNKGQLLFCLLNREHYQALRLTERVYEGNRKVFSTHGDYYNYPHLFGWRVEVITENNKYGL